MMRRSLNGYGLPSDSDSNTEEVLQRMNLSPRTAATASAALPPVWMATAAAVAAATAPAAGIEQQRLGDLARVGSASRTATTASRLSVQEIVFGRLGRVDTTEEQYPWISGGNKSSSNAAFISTNNVHKKPAATVTANPLKKRGIGHLLSPNTEVDDMKKSNTPKRQRKTLSPGGRSRNNSNNNNNDMMERLASMSGGFPMPKKWAAAFGSSSQKLQQKQQQKERKKSDSGSDLITWRNDSNHSLKGDRSDQRRSVAVTVPLSVGAFPMPRLAKTTTPGTGMVGPDSFQCFQQIWDDAAEKVKKNGWHENINDDTAFLRDLQKEVLQRQLRQQLG